MMTFGEKLQLLRRQKGLSQERLASMLTVSRQAVSKWELNSSVPDTENLVQISNIFHVSTDYLLKDDMEQTDALSQPDEATDRRTTRRRSSGTMMLVGGAGILVFQILSSVFPAVTSYAKAGADGAGVNEFVRYGLPAFLEINNLELLFILCCMTLVVGLLLYIYPYIKAKAKRAK